jgi:hypothetical protein
MAGYLHKRGDLVESDESIITIGYRDMFRLIGAINLTARFAKNQWHQRKIISIHFRIQTALRNGKHSFSLDLDSALAVSKALMLLYNKPISNIIKEAVSAKDSDIKRVIV